MDNIDKTNLLLEIEKNNKTQQFQELFLNKVLNDEDINKIIKDLK